MNNALATIRALSAYKHADHFNKRVVEKAKLVSTEDESEAKKETASVVKEIKDKEIGIVPEVIIEKKPSVDSKKPIKKTTKK